MWYTNGLNTYRCMPHRRANIRHQYTLGYVPNHAARPGVFRKIQVVARATGKTKLFVRTRSGYISGGETVPVKDEDAK